MGQGDGLPFAAAEPEVDFKEFGLLIWVSSSSFVSEGMIAEHHEILQGQNRAKNASTDSQASPRENVYSSED